MEERGVMVVEREVVGREVERGVDKEVVGMGVGRELEVMAVVEREEDTVGMEERVVGMEEVD